MKIGIRTETRRIQNIVERLLDLSALENRMGLKDVEVIDIKALVGEIVQSQAAVLERKRVSITIAAPEVIRTIGGRFLLRRRDPSRLVSGRSWRRGRLAEPDPDGSSSDLLIFSAVALLFFLARTTAIVMAKKTDFLRRFRPVWLVTVCLAFLPYFPLSVLAVFAFGLGFLMLTPLLLMMVHAGMLRENFAHLLRPPVPREAPRCASRPYSCCRPWSWQVACTTAACCTRRWITSRHPTTQRRSARRSTLTLSGVCSRTSMPTKPAAGGSFSTSTSPT